MLQLGCDRYVVQGGDSGGWITRYQANLYPEHVVSGLNNFWLHPPEATDLEKYHASKATEDEELYIGRVQGFFAKGWAYGHIHQTRPLRLAHAMTDSPVGLAMWILDSVWPVVDEPEKVWTPETLITWTMMHWIQGPYGPSRIYKEGGPEVIFHHLCSQFICFR